MSRYNDPRVIEWARGMNGRKKRALKQLKRLEAIERNALTEPGRRSTKRHVSAAPRRHRKQATA